MSELTLRELWIPAGILLGFQVSLFSWRLERETEVGDKGDIPWLVPADYLSIAGMLTFVLGVILLPVAELVTLDFARGAFGLGALLFIGQALGLAGHYQLFNRTRARKFIWFPNQEKAVVGTTVLLSLGYLWILAGG